MASQNSIGPALPPNFKNADDSDDERDYAGPALPPGYKRGEPSSSSDESEEVAVKRVKTSEDKDTEYVDRTITRPTEMEREQKHGRRICRLNRFEKRKDEEDDGFFGPALPPGFGKKQSSPERPPVLGPALPPGFRRAVHDHDDDDGDEEGFPGPALPPGYKADSFSSDGEDEIIIGPMPSDGPVQNTVALDIERRARIMKDKLTKVDVPEAPSRETWMTELPPELQHIGVGARTFKKRSGPEKGDRSIWTDTPADTERKARERLERKKRGETEKDSAPQLSQKDLEMADKVSKYNKTTRSESLMSLHTKNMKEKAMQVRDKPVERRAFDRETDLQVNRFDEAQKHRLLKKSQELNTRFSHSNDRMFL
ncbi:GPALPP motifs-containing protein 1 isoform X1 [Hippocampus comes]|uniref:GPALPP motifs-containing protein 1 isoform X1 n=1 Tax=Hippocampus comes TaxID=109280 RepID=UPI00094E6D50|nr:PREDICTED: GPALPP motifs-containing protein 1 isoform X1 [Hippocampus comes]